MKPDDFVILKTLEPQNLKTSGLCHYIAVQP
nr:MAG TPA: hypothetical protein [Caudoviricetes sp.]